MNPETRELNDGEVDVLLGEFSPGEEGDDRKIDYTKPVDTAKFRDTARQIFGLTADPMPLPNDFFVGEEK